MVHLSKLDIWNRRFQNPIRQENVEQFKTKVNAYEERGFSSDFFLCMLLLSADNL